MYGWTRDDFVQEVVGGSYGSLEDYEQSPPPISPSDLEESDELISDNETAAED